MLLNCHYVHVKHYYGHSFYGRSGTSFLCIVLILYLLYFDFYFGLDLTVHVYPTDGYCYFVFVFNAIIFFFLSTVFHLISHSILLFFYLYSHYFYFLQWIWYYSWCTSIMVTSIIRGACSTTMHSYVM